MSANNLNLHRWMIDTRTLWQDEGALQNSSHLALLSSTTQASILQYYRSADRRMSLASHLLKHLAVARICHVPWNDITISRPGHSKPHYAPPTPSAPSLDFNVSHQAGLVALVATPNPASFRVGADIVCTTERNDLERIERIGFDAWLDAFADVFSASELFDLKYTLPSLRLRDGTSLTAFDLGPAVSRLCAVTATPYTIRSSASGRTYSVLPATVIAAKLRRFYAHWAVKEAYIKLTGDALLADWLRTVETTRLRVPDPVGKGEWGEAVVGCGVDADAEIEMRRDGQRIEDVRIEIRAFEADYLLATVVMALADGEIARDDAFPDWTALDVETDVMPWTAPDRTDVDRSDCGLGV
ncbi:MAG: hypothetical protein M1833_007252 [Piccolia ochrophora]|nr:MAG: hypothetical protein M1833_007252 [Piccolia ochrophora]